MKVCIVCFGHDKYCPYCFGKGFIPEKTKDAMDKVIDLNEVKPIEIHPAFARILKEHLGRE